MADMIDDYSGEFRPDLDRWFSARPLKLVKCYQACYLVILRNTAGRCVND